MENATKALLIAAAVLVAILIISLGLVVYNMASETIDNVNLSGQEIEAFNAQFQQYAGKDKRGSEVNALLKTVINSNMKSRAEGLTATKGQKFVEVVATNATSSEGGSTKMGTLQVSATSLTMEANTSKKYDIELTFNATTGYVETITIKDS